MAGNSNSGNRTGAPRISEKPITDALRLALKQNDQKALNNIIRNVVSQAQSGQQWAVQFITDRLEGRAVQPIESNAVIEHKFVKTPEKAKDDDWKQFLAHKAAVPKAHGNSTSNTGNGSAH